MLCRVQGGYPQRTVAFDMLTKFWTWIAYVFAIVVSWAAGLHDVFYGLLFLQAIDITTGILVAMRTKSFRSAIGKAGVQRRIATWAVILAVGVMQHNTGILQPPPEAEGFGGLGAAEWAAVGMSVMEFFSIIENAALLGVTVPSWLTSAMDKAKTLLGLEPREPRENGK